jgi:hypothetical protein
MLTTLYDTEKIFIKISKNHYTSIYDRKKVYNIFFKLIYGWDVDTYIKMRWTRRLFFKLNSFSNPDISILDKMESIENGLVNRLKDVSVDELLLSYISEISMIQICKKEGETYVPIIDLEFNEKGIKLEDSFKELI